MSDTAPKTEPTDLDFFKLTRAQIEHEDQLINNRMTWLLSLQAFLFAAYGLSLSAESTIHNSAFAANYICTMTHIINGARVGFAWMTFLSSFVLLCGIAAAAESMLKLVREWNNRFIDREKEQAQYPQIIGAAVPFLEIWGGLFPTYFLPIASSGVWWWLTREYGISIRIGAVVIVVVAAFGICSLSRFRSEKWLIWTGIIITTIGAIFCGLCL